MPNIENPAESIGLNYPTTTGRLKRIKGLLDHPKISIALAGDSTLDNGVWVDKSKPYVEKTHTVTHQVAVALARSAPSHSFEIGNFAVDGAVTADLNQFCSLNKVLPTDSDHTEDKVHQLNALNEWKPDVVVLSVGGNNYREALVKSLRSQLSTTQLLFRSTPPESRETIRLAFEKVKSKLIKDYKEILDLILASNPSLKRLVLVSQYYPSLTQFTPYFIYTGFSHLSRASGKNQDAFAAVSETMEELYREVLTYAAAKGKEIVFADATSSINPLGGNHTLQIEPNEQGSKRMGQLIDRAITYSFPKDAQENTAIVRMSEDGMRFDEELSTKTSRAHYEVKKINEFIQDNRYTHLRLLFSASANLKLREECAYLFIMGQHFDTQYKGLFAFGLLDLSLVTVLASYLWRTVLDEKATTPLRVAAGVVAVPILTCKVILGMSLLLALSIPVTGYHLLASCFAGLDEVDDPPNVIPRMQMA